MEYLLTPYSKELTPFAWWEGAFTEQELNWLKNKASQATHPGMAGGEIQNEKRRSEVDWLEYAEDNKWVFKKLSHVVSELNAKYFNFDITGFGEALQLTNYHESRQGTYTWHQDFGSSGISRKLSMVLQLSDPRDYEGGELQLLTGKTPIKIEKKKGLITAFPAWTLHQVTPVTKGTRQTLVAWVSGPTFK